MVLIAAQEGGDGAAIHRTGAVVEAGEGLLYSFRGKLDIREKENSRVIY